jgi:hypothetical protein
VSAKATPSREVSILVSEKDATKMCGVSRPTFRKWVDAGLIARVDLPGNVRRNLFRRSDIEDFVSALPSGSWRSEGQGQGGSAHSSGRGPHSNEETP